MKSVIRFFFGGLLFIFSLSACAQQEGSQICINPEFDKKVANTISHTVDIISPKQLASIQNETFILDTRELKEYNVSHIPNAHYASYSKFDVAPFLHLPKDTTIVVYCSIGYRSEKIGEELKKEGFTKVYNLYGSLFEWVNQDYPLVDEFGTPTVNVHTYNKKWSKWVRDDGKVVKIW